MAKRTRHSKVEEPRGLVAAVTKILSEFSGIDQIAEVNVRGYKGSPKVKIPDRWQNRCPAIEICDSDFGQRTLIVRAQKPAPILRLLRKRLSKEGIAIAA